MKKLIGIFMLVLITAMLLTACGGGGGGGSNGDDDTPTPGVPTAGSLDSSFGSGGKVTTAFGSGDEIAYAVAIQTDLKIVVAGESSSGARKDFAISRYTTTGALDTSFGTGGKVTTAFGSNSAGIRAIAIQSDGKIVAAGYYTGDGTHTDFAISRYTTTGALDTSFGTGGKVVTSITATYNDQAYAVVIQPDDKIVAGGYFWNGFGSYVALVRYNDNGTLDTTGFGTAGIVKTPAGTARALAIQTDEKIVAIGYDSDFAAMRYSSNGTLDAGFGTGGKVTQPIGSTYSFAFGGTLQAGKIVAAGYSCPGFICNDDFTLARFDSSGVLDPGFGTSGTAITDIRSTDDVAYAMALQSDGKIVAAGYSSNGTDNDFALVRYSQDGVLDASFNATGKVITPIGSGGDEALAVAIQPDGKIVAAGFSHNGANNDFAIARYLP